MTNPAAVTRWLSSVYPTLQIDAEWLQQCLDYLSQHRPDLSAGPALLKSVEQQMLLSSLDACTSVGALPDGAQEMDDGVLSPGRAVLLQIVSMDEVGHSAISLRDTLQAKKEEAKLGAEADRVRVQGLTQEGEEEATASASFPRGMLKLQLSDGFSVMDAIEYRRIPSLSMDATQLGAKVLLKNARIRRGVLLLEPDTVTVKGGSVAELKEAQEELLEAQLAGRLDQNDST